MFVVRLTPPNEKDDFKVFAAKSDAEHHFWSGWVKIEDEGATAALYLVEGTNDPAEAVSATKAPDVRVTLLEARPDPTLP